MARDHARFDVYMWADDVNFQELSMVGKLVYMQLVCQPRLTYAGVLDLAVKRWARPHPDLDADQLRAALCELHAAGFVVVDYDTEEVLIRTFIRDDRLYKQPNVLAAALREAVEIESALLRSALAAELRNLPAEITGPAPAVVADGLERGDRVLSPEAKLAMSTRGTDRRAPSRPASGERPENPKRGSAKGSPSPSPCPRGEGSRERETGESPVPSRSKKEGLPARHAREAAQESTQRGNGPQLNSMRQARRAEAERLVDAYGEAVPIRVRSQLVAEVLGLLREGIDSAVIGSGLATWSSKTLPASFLPTLVGEGMRSARLASTSPEKIAQDARMAARFESLRAAAIAEDEQHGVGLAVREAQPRHADASTLTAILDAALSAAGEGAAA